MRLAHRSVSMLLYVKPPSACDGALGNIVLPPALGGNKQEAAKGKDVREA